MGYLKVIVCGWTVMDSSALTLCMESIMRVACGEEIGTIVK